MNKSKQEECGSSSKPDGGELSMNKSKLGQGVEIQVDGGDVPHPEGSTTGTRKMRGTRRHLNDKKKCMDKDKETGWTRRSPARM